MFNNLSTRLFFNSISNLADLKITKELFLEGKWQRKSCDKKQKVTLIWNFYMSRPEFITNKILNVMQPLLKFRLGKKFHYL